MADFGVVTNGTSLSVWSDPGSVSTPSRINPAPQRPLRFRTALTEDPIEIHAVVDGVESPLDSALDGRTFFGWFIEYPGVARPPVSSPPGQSSVRTFTPTTAGHYTYMLRRKQGGAIILHFEAGEFEGG